ncbi:unnamed protein product [Amaranthus hypochondriacus]
MSYARGNKTVRTESILDENKIYFSHVLSPIRKKTMHKNTEYINTTSKQHQQEQYEQQQKNGVGYMIEKAGYGENVDKEAENFIRKKHQKFELSYWNSNYY